MPYPSTTFLHLLLLFRTPPPILAASPIINNDTSTTCRNRCGAIPINFPFGTATGCGHPSFTRYIKCTSSSLLFTTGTGIYTVTSIDYAANTLTVSDPLMSTCTSMQNSGSFTLDKSSPFSLRPENIFFLLGCSATSLLFDSNENLCDTGSGSRVCRGLYSCPSVVGIGLEPNGYISTCCIYDGGGLGLGFGLDFLPKMQCSSYTSVYEFRDEGDPMKWKFGVSLGYNDSYYTKRCKDCEASGGVCGYGGLDQAFACVCRSGMINTTTNCFGQGYWSGTLELKVESRTIIGGFLLSWVLLSVRKI